MSETKAPIKRTPTLLTTDEAWLVLEIIQEKRDLASHHHRAVEGEAMRQVWRRAYRTFQKAGVL